MKLTTKTRYGTRLLLDLALHHDQGAVRVGEISSRQNISVKYLEQLIRPLKKAGLVGSIRGPKGGHYLTKDPETITLGQITRLFEGSGDLVECINDSDKCLKTDECVVRKAWIKAAQALFDQLDSITIANLMVDTKCLK